MADPNHVPAGPLEDTAHYYMECSNKGLCDRTTATCTCFVGYEGTSCQRASCPNDCSGHGVCKTNRELAMGDYGNIYELWDADLVSVERGGMVLWLGVDQPRLTPETLPTTHGA